MFFKEINSSGSFYVAEVCQHVPLYWTRPLDPLFSGESVYFHSIDGFSDSASLLKPHVYPIYKHFFDKNMIIRTHHRFFCNFRMVCPSKPTKIWRQTSVSFTRILNSLKINVCGMKMIIAIRSYQTMHSWKKFWKKILFFLFKNPPC